LPRIGRPIRLSSLSDEALARRAGRGDERAFAALYERYHQLLYGYCRSIVRADADAQDVLQSSFASALSALQRYEHNAPLRPWLFRIAHNEAISLLRRRARDATGGSGSVVPLTAPSVEEQVVDRARWTQLTTDLAELPDRLRSALLLRELAGLSHAEIASALGTTAGAAKQAIFEARRGLTELAEGRAMECDEICRRISDGDGRVLRGRRVRTHLRQCAACQAFAASIRGRQTELRALVPMLPGTAATAMLARASIAGSGPSATAAASAPTASSAAVTGTLVKFAGTTLTWKALAGAAVVATATAGVAGLTGSHHRHLSRVRQAVGAVNVGRPSPDVTRGAALAPPAGISHRRAVRAPRPLRSASVTGTAHPRVRSQTNEAKRSSGVSGGSPAVGTSGIQPGQPATSVNLARSGSRAARAPKKVKPHGPAAGPNGRSHASNGRAHQNGRSSTSGSRRSRALSTTAPSQSQASAQGRGNPARGNSGKVKISPASAGPSAKR
jgi:RNA polymerase sigma factor (sigma-70 family)